MTHCSIDELLAVRDGEGSQWAREHLEACGGCRHELESLYQRAAQLKALPVLSPARDQWPMIRQQVFAARARRRNRWYATAGLAAAAAVGGLILIRPTPPTPTVTTTAAVTDSPSTIDSPAPASGTARTTGAELAQVKHRSATLEAELQRWDPNSRVESGRAAAIASQLEDRIAAVDAALAGFEGSTGMRQGGNRQVLQLWQNRVDLMQQLMNVHTGRSGYTGF
jgi:hypothetical protein